MPSTTLLIWVISIVSVGLVIGRPWRVPEFVWAAGGAGLLLALGLLTPRQALAGVAKGLDVYLFLTGMMLLAETARAEKLFDWLAAHATRLARGSARRLFLLVYLVGVVVTVFLSNDATAVVLTPAVASAGRAARVRQPLPYLLSCAFVANAASFVLPLSNPANLVLYGAHLPSLLAWLPRYALPSVVAIGATYFLLRRTQRAALGAEVIAQNVPVPALGRGGRVALAGIALTAGVLLAASGLGVALGLPTALAGAFTATVVLVSARQNPGHLLRGISWSVLPLVAGLFVLVEALGTTGIIQELAGRLTAGARQSAAGATWLSGAGVALACNLLNNLPAGLLAGGVLQTAQVPESVRSAVLIGVDLGPNLSVTGSLATILWLTALRRENIKVSAGQFLRLGALVMTVPLLLALAALLVQPG